MGIFRNLIPTSYGYRERKHKHTHDVEQWNADLPNDNRIRQSVKTMQTSTRMKKKRERNQNEKLQRIRQVDNFLEPKTFLSTSPSLAFSFSFGRFVSR